MEVAIFFDSLIILGIVPTSMVAYFLLRDNQSRRHRIIAWLLLIFAGTIFYGSFIEPRIIRVDEEEIDLQEIDTPVTIAVFSDIQVGPYKREQFVQRVVDIIKDKKPDVILFPGDFVQNDGTQLEDESVFLKPLEQLTKIIPFIGVNGNHEHGVGGRSRQHVGSVEQETVKALTKLGVTVLENNAEILNISDQEFYIYGSDEAWVGQEDFSSFEHQEDRTTILLSHNPSSLFTFKEHANNNGIDPQALDLVVSGHTHGGQIRLPIIGPIGYPETLLPRKYYRGWSTWDGTPLFVTSGLGESGTRARLFVPPEIVLLTIK